jgi:hypothetical protein
VVPEDANVRLLGEDDDRDTRLAAHGEEEPIKGRVANSGRRNDASTRSLRHRVDDGVSVTEAEFVPERLRGMKSRSFISRPSGN